MNNTLFLVGLLFLNVSLIWAKKTKEKPDWAKKDIRDYSDADMERLLDQWEVCFVSLKPEISAFTFTSFQEDEEPLEPDELPEHLRPMPKIDMSNLNVQDPESLLLQTKKGRTLMTFVQVASNPGRDATEEITKLWQTSLWNNHIQAER